MRAVTPGRRFGAERGTPVMPPAVLARHPAPNETAR